MNTCNNNVSKSNRYIVFVKSTKVDEINIPKHNRNHQGLGYVPKKRRNVEFKKIWNQKKFCQMNYHTNMSNKQCYNCHKYGHIAAFCFYNYEYYAKPKIRQIWVPKSTNIGGPKQPWVPKCK